MQANLADLSLVLPPAFANLADLRFFSSASCMQANLADLRWLLHAAPPNDGPRHRLALSITYVSADAHVLDVADEEGLRRLPGV